MALFLIGGRLYESKNKICPKSNWFYACRKFANCPIYLFYARQNNGTFILRIEDTDVERYVEGAVEKF